MGLPAKLLGDGEQELLHLRSHGKTMIGPTAWLLVTSAVAGAGFALLPSSWQPWSAWAAAVIAVAIAIPVYLIPLLRWRTTTYTLTNHRLITRSGIITKVGHDVPVARITNVAYERSLTDRMFGCGSLVFTTSAEAPVVLHDIPKVEEVGVAISNLLFGVRA
ncbi:MAG: PH domain-containing protein [Micropruina sp.]|uniref:PH domain-containing protein n=1 Tax=Micropruina sp. TaxID=2737536 RepID=UPI0039E6CE5C